MYKPLQLRCPYQIVFFNDMNNDKNIKGNALQVCALILQKNTNTRLVKFGNTSILHEKVRNVCNSQGSDKDW